MRDIEVRLLGDLDVVVDDQPVPIGTSRERAVLEALALTPGDVVPAEALVDALWGEDPPRSATKTLHSHISRLRDVLPADTIATVDHGYRLDVPHSQVDAQRLSELLDEAELAMLDDDPFAAVTLADTAVGLRRGTPLPDLADGPRRAGRVARLEGLHDRARLLSIDAHLAIGDHDRMVPVLDELVEQQPFDERYWYRLMVALHRSGRRTDALDAYDRLRRLLLDELAIVPSADLRTLHERILRDDPDLAFNAPPPVSTLPTPISSFVGREELVDEVDEAIATHRLTTLVGPGGIGKTRIAIHVAEAARSRSPDGTFFVDLTGIDDITDAVDDLGRQLDRAHHRGGPGRPLEAVLARRSVLIVFDRAEAVADQLGPLVERLLAASEGTAALVTSRMPLGVTGEHVVHVPPMDVPAAHDDPTTSDSVRLFLERSDSHDPASDDLAAVVRLCDLVDGLPLGIELLATRASTMSPAGLVDQLDGDRRVVLAVEQADTNSHASLGAVLASTLEILTPDERRFLGRLTVFYGTFSTDAATAVGAASPGDPARDLARLVEVGLVHPADAARTRWRLLDTTRSFVSRLVDDEELADAQRAHAIHYARLARTLRDEPGSGPWSRRLAQDAANLRAAVRWYLTNDPVGALTFARTLAQEADRTTDLRRTRQLFEQLIDTAQRHDDAADDIAWAQIGVGWPRFLTGDVPGAIAAAEAAAERFTEAGDRDGACLAFIDRGHMELLATAELALAAPWYERGLAVAPRGSLRRAAGLVDYAQALVLHGRADEMVERMLAEASDVFHRANDHHRLSQVAMCRTLAAYIHHDTDATIRHAREAIRESELAGVHFFGQPGHLALGVVQLHGGNAAAAWPHFRAALTIADEKHNVLQTAMALQAIAVMLVLLGRADDAEPLWVTGRAKAPLWPLFADLYRRLLGAHADRFERAFDRAHADGTAASLDEAVASALLIGDQLAGDQLV